MDIPDPNSFIRYNKHFITHCLYLKRQVNSVEYPEQNILPLNDLISLPHISFMFLRIYTHMCTISESKPIRVQCLSAPEKHTYTIVGLLFKQVFCLFSVNSLIMARGGFLQQVSINSTGVSHRSVD